MLKNKIINAMKIKEMICSNCFYLFAFELLSASSGYQTNQTADRQVFGFSIQSSEIRLDTVNDFDCVLRFINFYHLAYFQQET